MNEGRLRELWDAGAYREMAAADAHEAALMALTGAMGALQPNVVFVSRDELAAMLAVPSRTILHWEVLGMPTDRSTATARYDVRACIRWFVDRNTA